MLINLNCVDIIYVCEGGHRSFLLAVLNEDSSADATINTTSEGLFNITTY